MDDPAAVWSVGRLTVFYMKKQNRWIRMWLCGLCGECMWKIKGAFYQESGCENRQQDAHGRSIHSSISPRPRWHYYKLRQHQRGQVKVSSVTYAHGRVAVDDPHDPGARVARHTDAEARPVSLLHHQALGLLQHLRLAPLLLLLHGGFPSAGGGKEAS